VTQPEEGQGGARVRSAHLQANLAPEHPVGDLINDERVNSAGRKKEAIRMGIHRIEIASYRNGPRHVAFVGHLSPRAHCFEGASVCRTLAISCEAVPAVSCRRGHEAAPLVWCSCNQPGAAESLVCFIALFCGPDPVTDTRCRHLSGRDPLHRAL
jgi:hypothetical protein